MQGKGAAGQSGFELLLLLLLQAESPPPIKGPMRSRSCAAHLHLHPAIIVASMNVYDAVVQFVASAQHHLPESVAVSYHEQADHTCCFT